MQFKKSFNELKKVIVWMHYIFGTLGLYFVFKYIFSMDIIGDLHVNYYKLIVFWIVYAFIDRSVHAILEI